MEENAAASRTERERESAKEERRGEIEWDWEQSGE
jgi:hypothetical protein